MKVVQNKNSFVVTWKIVNKVLIIKSQKNDIHKSEHFAGLDMCVLYQDVRGQIFG
jgi:hypothetical protein